MPRGTIHQAVAQEEGSTHLTLSTYQNWTWGSFAACVIHTVLDSQGEVRQLSHPSLSLDDESIYTVSVVPSDGSCSADVVLMKRFFVVAGGGSCTAH